MSNLSYLKNIILFSFLALVMVGGYFRQYEWFVLNPDIYNRLVSSSFLFSIALVLVLVIYHVKTGFDIRPIRIKRYVLRPRTSKFHRILLYPMFFIGIFTFSYVAIVFALPPSLHVSLSSPGEVTFIIEKIRDGRKAPRCFGFKGYAALNGRICRVPSDTWNKAEKGDFLVTTGTESSLGFYIEDMKLIKKG